MLTPTTPLVYLLAATAVGVLEDTPDNVDCDGNAGSARWVSVGLRSTGFAYVDQRTIQEKISAQCEEVPPPPNSKDPGPPLGEPDPPIMRCPYDGNIYTYTYNSESEAEVNIVIQGRPEDFMVNAPPDFWTKTARTYPEDAEPPYSTEGDEFGCEQCPNPNCSAVGCERGGFYSAVQYAYGQYMIRKQVRNGAREWEDCPGCEESNVGSFTYGVLRGAVVRNSQRPYVDALKSAEELCELEPDEDQPPDDAPPAEGGGI